MPFDPTWSEDDFVGAREHKKFGEDEQSNTAVRVISHNIETRLDAVVTAIQNINAGGGGGAGNAQRLEKVPFTILISQVDQWLPVPLTNIDVVADVNVFDSTDYEEVICDVRLSNNGTGVEIRTTSPQTLTIHVEGYKN